MKLFSLLLAVGLVGCAAPPAKISVPFDESHAARLMLPGSNTIKGSALLRQQNGGVVTCAGQEVRLVPATDYAKARFERIYGTQTLSRTGVNFEGTPAAYLTNSRAATCDAQGFFTFQKVSDGEFFLATQVTWMVGMARQGGVVMARVTVAGGEHKDVVLTSN